VTPEDKERFIRAKADEHLIGETEKIMWSLHAVRKLRMEGLRERAVEEALSRCVLIEDYATAGRPLPAWSSGLEMGVLFMWLLLLMRFGAEYSLLRSTGRIKRGGIMIGEKEREKSKECPLCGGTMTDSITTVPFLMGDRIVVIKNVPAEICSDCGEAYMKSSVVGRVEGLLDRLEELGSEVSIVHYEAA
jgi:YgiT-type zinc finger domain-containing protein